MLIICKACYKISDYVEDRRAWMFYFSEKVVTTGFPVVEDTQRYPNHLHIYVLRFFVDFESCDFSLFLSDFANSVSHKTSAHTAVVSLDACYFL